MSEKCRKIIFCNIAYMKYYRGVTDEDKPSNGGRWVEENGTAYECYNFMPFNHFCYGYFQHVGKKVDIGRVENVSKNIDFLKDITVIWVANRKIAGLYDNSIMYRNRTSFTDNSFDPKHTEWYHWFKAREENVYLVPHTERNFVVPSATRLGVGKGMGQSSIWYADTDWARENLLPQVNEYLDYVRANFPISYLTLRDVNKKISPPQDLTAEQLWAKADELLDAGTTLTALGIYNYFVIKSDSPYKICVARYKRAVALEKLLMYDEAIISYKRAIYEINKLENKFEDDAQKLRLNCYINLTRLYMVKKDYQNAYPLCRKLFQEIESGDEKYRVLFNMMLICEHEKAWHDLKDLIDVYDNLKTNDFADEVNQFRNALKRAKV